MINRRSLRIKAFKNLYAFESCKGANHQLALDFIDQKFSPDLNSMEVMDKSELEKKRKAARELFENQLLKSGDRNGSEVHTDQEIEDTVKEAFVFLDNQNKADQRNLLKNLQQEADIVLKDQLIALSMLEEFAFLNKKLSDEKKNLTNLLGEKAQIRTNLYQNRIIAKMSADKMLQTLKAKYKIGWANDHDTLRDWYKGILNKDETYRQYNQKEKTTYDEDWGILDYICRVIIFKNDVFSSYFEDKDLDWMDNQTIVRSLVLKTLKSVREEYEVLQVADISYNWEDDSEYVQELFKIAIRENDYLEGLLKERLLNWDIERVALTDKVLMKLALTEMIYFPSIPTKVTINEFIEISKTFSTPKSKKFVNGILDGLSLDLIDKGVIKKSGRGLLDNK